MSTTYNLVCHDCKQKYWSGQTNYTYSKDNTDKFLFAHAHHRIEFVDDLLERKDIESYEDIEPGSDDETKKWIGSLFDWFRVFFFFPLCWVIGGMLVAGIVMAFGAEWQTACLAYFAVGIGGTVWFAMS
jgi:hypothetical protein